MSRALVVVLLACACRAEPPPGLAAPFLAGRIPLAHGAAMTDRLLPPVYQRGDVWIAIRLPDAGEWSTYEAVLTNVMRAAELLSYSVAVGRGDKWRFNERVGERTLARGFVPAPTLFLGREAADVGGGVCIVASALYQALMLGGYGVLERHPHTRPRAYAEPGLDAAVNFPDLDLVFINNRLSPITVTGHVEDGVLFVGVLSDEDTPWVWSEWRREAALPFGTRRQSSPFVRREQVYQRGESGLSGLRVWHYADGELKIRSVYRPTPEVVLEPNALSALGPWSE